MEKEKEQMEVEKGEQYIAIGFITGKHNVISMPSYQQFLDYKRLVARYRSLSEKHTRFSFGSFCDSWRLLEELGQSHAVHNLHCFVSQL